MRSVDEVRGRGRARWDRPGAILIAAGVAFAALLALRALTPLEPPPALHAAIGLAVVAAALREAGLEARANAIVIGGLGCAVLYLSYTGAADRHLDAGVHLYYVRYVAEHHALPPKAACTVCHHPPAYYAIAAIVFRALTLAGAADPTLGLQVLSLAAFAAFLACAALTVQRLLPEGPARLCATALVAFWPSGIYGSVRVSNDTMVWAIGGGVMLCLSRWHEDRSARALWAASILAALGIATKASALAAAGLVLAVVAWDVARAWRAPDRRRTLRAAGPPLAVLILAVALLGTARRERTGDLTADVLGTAALVDPLWRTPRTPRFYLTFDPASFVEAPFVALPLVGTSEPTYWNHLLKSSLTGTRRVLLGGKDPEPASIARAMNALLLAMLAYLALGQLAGLRRPSPGRAFAAIAAAVFLAAGLAFHLLVPYPFHADFRFIHPVVAPLAVLYAGAAVLTGERSRVLEKVGCALSVGMVALSIAYFVPATWGEAPRRGRVVLPPPPAVMEPGAAAPMGSGRARWKLRPLGAF